MIFSFLKKPPPLDEDSVQWLFESFAWSLRNFDADVFRDETILVIPSNEHFPGRVDSVHGMASLIFEQVKEYAGMKHWPCRLVDQMGCAVGMPPEIQIEGALRGSGGVISDAVDDANRPVITYDPKLIGNPEALIASYAHTLAHYLGGMARELPPGGEENWPQVTEVLALFMGFGLMFANSAFTFKGGCGSCGASAERHNYLSQFDMTYALAIFCVLKDIPNNEVVRHLKKSLRSFYKDCVKDVNERRDELDGLRY